MGDRTTEFRDCPKCGSKGTFECYEALSSNTKLDECSKCGYTVNYSFEEQDGVIHIEQVNGLIHTGSKGTIDSLKQPKQAGTTPSTELLHEHFYKWLEASGVVLDDQLDSGEWRSNIDLNKLKTAILTEVTQERNKAWEEATAKFEACLPKRKPHYKGAEAGGYAGNEIDELIYSSGKVDAIDQTRDNWYKQ